MTPITPLTGSPTIDDWIIIVVIVDDDFVSAVCMEALLVKEGFKCFKALSGAEGRELVRAKEPDLVLLDIQMPKENGLETCRLLKADPVTADIPVIFLTGAEDLNTKLDGFAAGAVDYITKPYQSAEVLARIQVHIRARKTARLLAASQMAQLDRLAHAQKAILPSPNAIPSANFEVFYKPIHRAGGDFYDVLQVGEGIFDYVVADVCGHDADASLVTSALKVLLHQGRSTLSSPMDTLRMVNTALRSAFPDHLYLTLLWARLNRNRKVLTVLLAGHPPLLLLDHQSGVAEYLGASGDLLGSFDSIELEEIQHPVSQGDRLLLFTDGLIEMPMPGESPCREDGLKRLQEAAHKRWIQPLPEQVHGIVTDLLADVGEVSDDLLLLGLEV